jgi:phosphohistidine phosphatase
MTSSDPIRRLILLRHAKSEWPPGVHDLERPLAPRGEADAAAAGRAIAAGPAMPDLVLCSPALRARQTWAHAVAELAVPPPASYQPSLYGADPDGVIALVRTVDPGVQTVVVVGHEPTTSATAERLAGPGSADDELARLRAKFPTSGLAVFTVAGPWAELADGGGALERFVIPRG